MIFSPLSCISMVRFSFLAEGTPFGFSSSRGFAAGIFFFNFFFKVKQILLI